MSLIELSPKGLYCKQADVYIDPWKPVSRALITHGHSDHARRGHKHYLSTYRSIPILKQRLGKQIKIQGTEYGSVLNINGVKISFHPAGHVVGSAQIRLEYKGESWGITGDYKIEDDGISEAYEPINCQHFITESTFGMPIYRWRPQAETIGEMNSWWTDNKSINMTSIITAYSLGKAQRILYNIDSSIGQIFCHPTIDLMNRACAYRDDLFPKYNILTDETSEEDLKGALVLTPSSALAGAWVQRAKAVSIASASGWMMTRGSRKRRSTDRGFVLSDHCDWDDLLTAVKATGASHIYPTHGFTAIFAKHLRELGYYSQPLETQFEGEKLEGPST